MPAISKIQIRHGSAAAWTSANPILSLSEPGRETDTGKEKRGDGTSPWNSLPYHVPGRDVFVNQSAQTYDAPGLGLFFPEAHGALGNGSTNDTTAIQAAINAASTANGGTVLFRGTSYLTGTLTVPSNVTLAGAGRRSTILLANANSIPIISFAGTGGTPVTHAAVRNLGLYANGHTGVVGITGTYAYWISLDHLYGGGLSWIVRSTGSSGYWRLSGVESDWTSNGFDFQYAVNSTVTGCTLSDLSNMAVGIHIGTGCDGIGLVSVNINGGTTAGILQDNSGGGTEPQSISYGNVQSGSGSGDAWQIYAGEGTQLTNCLAVTAGGWGYRLRANHGTTFTNCNARYNAMDGFLCDTGGGATGNFTWTGGVVAGNSYGASNVHNGFNCGNNAQRFSVTGAKLGHSASDPHTETQQYGLVITQSGGTADYFAVVGCLFGSNVTAGYVNTATGTHTQFLGNV